MKDLTLKKETKWKEFFSNVVLVIVSWGALLLILILFYCVLKHFNFFSDFFGSELVYEISYTINGEEKNYFAFEPERKKEQLKITTIDKEIIYIDLRTLDSELVCQDMGIKTPKEIQELKDTNNESDNSEG